jgi:hypothetical protein
MQTKNPDNGRDDQCDSVIIDLLPDESPERVETSNGSASTEEVLQKTLKALQAI